MAEKLGKDKIEIIFEAECDGVLKNNDVAFYLGRKKDTRKIFTAERAVIGADGAFSKVRTSLGKQTRYVLEFV